MIAKIAIFLAVVAVAYGGVAGVVSVAHSPASTIPLARHVAVAPVVTYAAGPAVVHSHHAIAHHAPIAYAAAPVAVPAPIAYATAPRVVHTYEPVEQHGYKIAY